VAEPGSAVTVIGAGRMGTQLAAGFALHGHQVHLVSSATERAMASLVTLLAEVTEDGLAGPEQASAAHDRLHVHVGVNEVPTHSGLVLETIAEDYQAKTRILREAAARFPEACLATNTSSLPISSLATGVGQPGRLLGLHFWHPPLYMPLVEVIAAPTTQPDVVATAKSFVSSAGWIPVTVRKDVPGFVWNRLQCALLREALWLVGNGVCSAGDIDLVARLGLARRWHVSGPMESVKLGGVQTWATVTANLFPELSNAAQPPDLSEIAAGSDSRDLARQRQARLAQLMRRDEADTPTTASGPS
jgi:3-hydroxybutyryl-CoA dehydrogenase